jgi:hypothetical protein
MPRMCVPVQRAKVRQVNLHERTASDTRWREIPGGSTASRSAEAP